MEQSNLHVAIIMDGNGRWAARCGLPRAEGHRAGTGALRRVVEAAPGLGIGTLSVYAFSSDNWKRPPDEVDALMALLAWHLEGETPRCASAGVRIRAFGRRDRLPQELVDAIARAEDATKNGANLELRIAIDYSARESILRAIRAVREGHAFEGALADSQPVDLLIRTGGEQRLSDFLLWECAYAELVFTPRMWPDFTVEDLGRAIMEYSRRERRFGALPSSPAPLSQTSERWLR